MSNRTQARALGALIVAGALLVACDSERSAESKTRTSEAEVSTDASPAQVTDQQLQQAAADAANAAAATASATAPADGAATGAAPSQ